MTRHVPSLFDFQDFRLPPRLVSSVRQVPIPVRAGDVIFFHSLVWHSSSANASDTARYAEIASFMAGESRVKGSSSAHFPRARRTS
jgi:ectoine hydroxylase-related dioxygenase (phytanoyl-CoA dioxygenase family)